MLDQPEPNRSDLELMLARAFDLAWQDFLHIEGDMEDTADNRGCLAARIVVLAKVGERNEEQLAAAALIYLRALAAARRLGGVDQMLTAVESFKGEGASLDQDGIDAATGALEACLEDLPDGIPGEVRSVLIRSILENAGKGERNSNRLRDLALETLRSRR